MLLNPNFDSKAVKKALKEKLDTISPPGIHVDQLPSWLASNIRVDISPPQVEILLYELFREGQAGKSITDQDGSCRWWSKSSSDLLERFEDFATVEETLARLVKTGAISPNTARKLAKEPHVPQPNLSRQESPSNRPPPLPAPPLPRQSVSKLRLKVPEGMVAIVTGRDLKVEYSPDGSED